ncbi:D-alanine--D-alanine ligase family protein [Desulfovibrio oxyclinae]|uniref:D-alanine--D-alanine ligase family protein n=1 Tax=Desulfovibrio oxyclinae TaxID=63560 RepID=UPI000477D63A|nr:D-alanine--D-alanine ligase [Desulfovibrio oxyclinae]
MNLLLIAGGWSSERDVSLSGARKIHTAMENLGHSVRFLDPALEFDTITEAAEEAEFAFINMHGSPGEDGLVQAMLDAVGCPYQGAGASESFMALNKAASKQLFRRAGIPTPDWQLVTSRPDESWKCELELPVFVKPNCGGSSVGMGLVREPEQLLPAVNAVFDLCDEAIIEPYMPGVELTCGMLGGRALPLIMIKPKPGSEFFDYANKYDADGAEEICPAPVDDAITEAVQGMTLVANEALGLTGYSRADFILSDGQPWLLEVNTLPGMTPTSLLPQAAAELGLTFEGLIAELIRTGMRERG